MLWRVKHELVKEKIVKNGKTEEVVYQFGEIEFNGKKWKTIEKGPIPNGVSWETIYKKKIKEKKDNGLFNEQIGKESANELMKYGIKNGVYNGVIVNNKIEIISKISETEIITADTTEELKQKNNIIIFKLKNRMVGDKTGIFKYYKLLNSTDALEELLTELEEEIGDNKLELILKIDDNLKNNSYLISDYEVKMTYYISDAVLKIETPEEVFEIRATSGRGKDMNKVESITKPFSGPIPIGTYIIKPQELSDPNVYGDLLRRFKGDWGDWRVRLHPKYKLKTDKGIEIKRDNFFLHGGDMEGSAGCIDIGGNIGGNDGTHKIKNIIIKSKKIILVEVNK